MVVALLSEWASSHFFAVTNLSPPPSPFYQVSSSGAGYSYDEAAPSNAAGLEGAATACDGTAAAQLALKRQGVADASSSRRRQGRRGGVGVGGDGHDDGDALGFLGPSSESEFGDDGDDDASFGGEYADAADGANEKAASPAAEAGVALAVEAVSGASASRDKKGKVRHPGQKRQRRRSSDSSSDDDFDEDDEDVEEEDVVVPGRESRRAAGSGTSSQDKAARRRAAILAELADLRGDGAAEVGGSDEDGDDIIDAALSDDGGGASKGRRRKAHRASVAENETAVRRKRLRVKSGYSNGSGVSSDAVSRSSPLHAVPKTLAIGSNVRMLSRVPPTSSTAIIASTGAALLSHRAQAADVDPQTSYLDLGGAKPEFADAGLVSAVAGSSSDFVASDAAWNNEQPSPKVSVVTSSRSDASAPLAATASTHSRLKLSVARPPSSTNDPSSVLPLQKVAHAAASSLPSAETSGFGLGIAAGLSSGGTIAAPNPVVARLPSQSAGAAVVRPSSWPAAGATHSQQPPPSLAYRAPVILSSAAARPSGASRGSLGGATALQQRVKAMKKLAGKSSTSNW
jgi:hypothetical protein